MRPERFGHDHPGARIMQRAREFERLRQTSESEKNRLLHSEFRSVPSSRDDT